NRPDTNFQTGLPIDAAAGRVLIDPAIELGHRLAGVALVSGQEICLGQPRQVLVTVQLVDDLGIASSAVLDGPIVSPKTPLPYPAGDRVTVPVNLRTELDRSVAEKCHLVPAQFVRLVGRPVDPLGKLPVDK